ncbi:MAG: nitrate- and nitrite sensing domain-containing protein, partial [Gammaproteobacteria bacterium]|nr:nitrate- and nitrite sensing domain-containing protein [Gammaproteobacteria bacterium]
MSIFQQISSVLTNTVQKLILNYASQLLILTLILFCFAGYVTYQSRATLAEIENAERMIDATNISHCLFKAMGKWAYERGLTHSALNSGTKITQEVQDKITKAISESDNHFQWLYQELENSDYIDEHGKDILADIKKNKKDISALRFEASEKIIKNNNKKIKKIDDKLFNKYIEMIENAYELQEGISVSISCEEDEDECGILLSNIKLLQNIWMVREYAGRERAIISAYIARNEQFKINELLGYRNEVNDSLEIINEYMKDNVDRLGATPVHSSLFKINDDFLKKLEEARNDIYNKNKLKINQTISSIEWFEVSSKGIDAFQGFAAAVSDDSKLIIKSLKQNNMDKLHEYKTSIALILIITAFMFFLLFKKIVLVIKSAILFNKGHKIAGLLFNSSGSSARERGKTYLMLNTINKDENS